MFYHGFLDPWGWAWSIVGLLITIIMISIFVRIIIRIVRGDHHHHHHWDGVEQEDPSASARKILDERYARGEIDDEEYKRKRENLK
jgi:putative membrane protein